MMVFCGFSNQALCEAKEYSVLSKVEHQGAVLTITKIRIINVKPRIFSSSQIPGLELDGYIELSIKIENTSQKMINYGINWMERRLSLTDEFDGRYYQVYTGSELTSTKAIYPGKSSEFTVSFQKPSPNAKQFTLAFAKGFLFPVDIYQAVAQEDPEIKLHFNSGQIEHVEGVIEGIGEDSGSPPKLGEKLKGLGEELQVKECIIKVKEIRLGHWSPAQKILNQIIPYTLGDKENQVTDNKKVTMASISYEFKNGTKDVKMDFGDLSGNFSLTDNIGNKYYAYSKPKDFHDPNTKPEHFPSIYPGESYADTIFFEPPVKGAQYLLLKIEALTEDMEEYTVKIPLDKLIKSDAN